MCLGKTLNLDVSSKSWRNFEGILGNPGEIPHIGRKILGVYRVSSRPVFKSAGVIKPVAQMLTPL